MSFLNSVLSSIGGGTPYIPAPPAPTPSGTNSRVATQTSRNGTSSTLSRPEARPEANSGQKRKADEELQRNTNKASKSDTVRPAPPPNRFQPSKPIARPNGIASNSSASIAASRPSVPKVSKTAQPPPAAAAAPASSASKVPPKKGSYAEILARAQAAQSSSKQVGVIKHKPVEKLTRKERLAQQAEAAAKAKQGASGKGRNEPKDKVAAKGAAALSGKGSDSEITKKKQPVDVGYKGTMRPKSEEPMYKGTMNRSREAPVPKPAPKRVPSRYAGSELAKAGMPLRPSSRYTYASYSDEEDSEGSSDMEAAAYELEEEEQLSLRTARREDEEALSQEMELKRMKEEKKKRLAQMAAKRR